MNKREVPYQGSRIPWHWRYSVRRRQGAKTREGISGHICRSVMQIAKRAQGLNFNPLAIRQYVEDNFSIERMAKEYARVYEDILQGIDARRIA